MIRLLLRRAAGIVLGLVLVAALALAAFRIAAALRETETAHRPPRAGRFAATVLGQVRYQERGDARARPVLFVAGTMAPSDTFLPLLDELCDERLRCLAIDLPPFGYSERPADGDYGRVRQAARIDAFLRAVGMRDAVVVGHSFGAGPVVEAAMRYPEDVATFALLSGALGLRAAPSSPILRGALAVGPLRTAFASATFVNPGAVRLSLRRFIANDAIVTNELVGRYSATSRVEGAAWAVGRWAQTALFADESGTRSGQPSSYRAYGRPVLLVWGDRDVATPLPQAKDLESLLPAARLTVLPGVGHFPHVESQAAVAAALRSFLTGGEDARPANR